MSSIQSLSIRRRLHICVALVLLSSLLIGAGGTFVLRSLKGEFDGFVQREFSIQGDVADLWRDVGNLRRYEKDVLLSAGHDERVARYTKQWRDTMQSAMVHLDHIDQSLRTEENKALVRKIREDLQAYGTGLKPAAEQLGTGMIDAGVANQMIESAKQRMYQAEQGLEKLDQGVATVAQRRQEALAATVDLDTWVLLALVVVPALVFVPLMLLTVRSIVRPLDRARELTAAIAAGDLTREVRAEGSDEMAELMRSLAGMQSALRNMVTRVRATTESIGTASTQIASGNQDLSSRTEQTASSLQQTASSIEQITGNVRQSADTARQANQFAHTATAAARRGGGVVSQVVSSMDEISAASRKIADIIGVIDGIAFQTNILALNAAVEAARAGEQGRGFAVVAGEVRTLAQRSAQAAREIKSLIGASVEKVEGGARLVQDAGAAMTEIVASVQRVTDMMAEITAAAAEQSDGIGQVNQAVAQLDQMTQQNAALVEESAAAAESLRDQAGRLAEVVAQFRCGDEGPALRAAAATARQPARPQPAPAPARAEGGATRPATPVTTTATATDDDWTTF